MPIKGGINTVKTMNSINSNTNYTKQSAFSPETNVIQLYNYY